MASLGSSGVLFLINKTWHWIGGYTCGLAHTWSSILGSVRDNSGIGITLTFNCTVDGPLLVRSVFWTTSKIPSSLSLSISRWWMAPRVGKCSWSTGSLCAHWLPSYWICWWPKRMGKSPTVSEWRRWVSVTSWSMEPHSTHVNMGFSPSASYSRACPTSWRWVEVWVCFLFS